MGSEIRTESTAYPLYGAGGRESSTEAGDGASRISAVGSCRLSVLNFSRPTDLSIPKIARGARSKVGPNWRGGWWGRGWSTADLAKKHDDAEKLGWLSPQCD